MKWLLLMVAGWIWMLAAFLADNNDLKLVALAIFTIGLVDTTDDLLMLIQKRRRKE